MLSHLKGGNAERYKTLWVEQKKATATAAGTGLDYGTTAQFAQNLQKGVQRNQQETRCLARIKAHQTRIRYHRRLQ